MSDNEILGDYANRRIYNAIINSAIEAKNTKNRKFTSLDFYPTTLASMGVKIEGNQLGLGVNLFSDKPTLLEKYENFNEELSKKSTFYNNKILYSKWFLFLCIKKCFYYL